MSKKKITLFHNNYRQLFYKPRTKTMVLHWYGDIPEEEQLKHIEYMKELIKEYEIDHMQVYVRKAKFLSLKPIRTFFEQVLTRINHRGGKSFTLFLKPVNNLPFLVQAYKNALKSMGITMEVQVKTA